MLNDIGSVELLDHMGNDLTVVNCARVSFDKQRETLDESDERLIRYLARNNHWTPFSQVQIQFRITMPIFVSRQWYKHQVGFTRNEVSRRYVDTKPEFYVPEKWRLRHESAKQGSSDETITHWADFPEQYGHAAISEDISNSIVGLVELYESMIAEGIAPEMARMVLPQSMFTSFVETASLAAYARLCKLRLDPHSQWETQLYAGAVYELLHNIAPVSWAALMDNTR